MRIAIEVAIRKCLAEILDIVDVSLEANLDTLGLDSLDKLELLMWVEDKFELEINDHVAAEWETLNDVIKYIEEST